MLNFGHESVQYFTTESYIVVGVSVHGNKHTHAPLGVDSNDVSVTVVEKSAVC